MGEFRSLAWNSEEIQPGLRRRAFEDLTETMGMPWQIQGEAERLSVDLKLGEVGENKVLRLGGSVTGFERSSREIRAGAPENLALMVMARPCRLIYGGRELELAGGDVFAFDPTRAIGIKTSSGLDLRAYCISVGLLEPEHVVAWDSDRFVLGGGQPLARLIRALLEPLDSLAATVPATALLASLQHAGSLMAIHAHAHAAAREGGRSAVREGRLNAARRLISERYADPALGPAEVAAELGCSVRTLHQAFESTGRTFNDHLTGRRLRCAWEALRADTLPRRSIATIAYDCGFNELSTFNRRFRQAFGLSPREMREAARNGLVGGPPG